MTASVSGVQAWLQKEYSSIKQLFPSDGRRRCLLRAAATFWALDPQGQLAIASLGSNGSAELSTIVDDDDPWDILSTNAPGLGLLVRTDFSNEEVWQRFMSKLQEAEREIAAASTSAAEDEDGSMQADDKDDSSSESDDGRPPVFTVVNPTEPPARLAVTGISNLAALRLLSDVNIRPAPPRPEGVKAHQPANRLIDYQGLQEVYQGKGVWIYDGQSNVDESVRVVSLQGDIYGTATADSWRARVGHICELQLNIALGAMKVDFGGLDRYDYAERTRNLHEAETYGI